MTVTSTQSVVRYTGDGVTQIYSVPFEAMDRNDIQVSVGGTRLSQDIHYGVTGDVAQPGFSVMFIAPPAPSVEIVIRRLTTATQDSVYTPYGPYRASQVERDFDRAMMLAQEERDAIDNPLPWHAVDVIFTPVGGVSATNVQDAIAETDVEFRQRDQDLAIALVANIDTRASKYTQIVSDDPQMLAVLQPTLEFDVRLVPISNVPGGAVKLDASGKIPSNLIAALGLVFLGTWSPSIDGPTPPGSSGAHGDMYIFDAVGDMTLAESTNTTPHTVSVFINDYMVWDSAALNWYYVNAAQQQIITAAGVLFVPVGTLGSTNVQNAISELDASISLLYREEGDESTLYRRNAFGFLENVLRSSSEGIRLMKANVDKLVTGDYGIAIRGAQLSSSPVNTSEVAFQTIDGIPLGRVGFIGDASMWIFADRPGAALRIAVTNAAAVSQLVLVAVPGDMIYLHDGDGAQRFFVNANGAGVVSSADASALFQAALADRTSLYRIGLPAGVPDFYLAIDKPGALFRVQLAGAAQGNLVLTPTTFATGGDIQAGGQVVAVAPVPLSPGHLTRKDYVDNLINSAAIGYESSPRPTTAGFVVPHGLGGYPKQVWGTLHCVIPQAGYAAGDVLSMPSPTNVFDPNFGFVAFGYSVHADSTNVAFARSTNSPYIIPATGGAMTQLLESNWNVVIHARK